MSLIDALRSDGVHQFDDLTHLLMARWTREYPAYLLDDWGRPGFTALYALPAQWGWTAARMWSVLLSAITAWWAYRIADREGFRLAWLVPGLVYLQPLYFNLSQTTLTETATAFYLTGAIYLAQRRRWSLSAALVSLSFVTRHEAIVLLPVWLIVASVNGVALWRLWPIVWAPVVVNVAAYAVGMPTVVSRWLEPRPSSQYGRGGWLTFLSRSLEAWGPSLSALGWAGVLRLNSTAGGGLVGGSIVVFFLAQTAIRALGAYDSGGYPRFLVPISPLIGIAAARCLEHLFATRYEVRRRAVIAVGLAFIALWIALEVQIRRPEVPAFLPEIHRGVWAMRISTGVLALLAVKGWLARGRGTGRRVDPAPAVGAALAVLAALAFWHMAGPLRAGPGEAAASEAMAWVRSAGLADRPIVTAHVYVEYLSGRVRPAQEPGFRRRAAAAPIGALIVWDRQFAPAPGNELPLESLRSTAAFRERFAGRPLPGMAEPQIRIFEKVAPWGSDGAP
ncbi:MAG: hypothetical protein L6Q92_11910 [Phycisphaerae bacterium]|nr:hypothetical protein [Phycisphaerae bacterium]